MSLRMLLGYIRGVTIATGEIIIDKCP
jgi:hypothetical protein